MKRGFTLIEILAVLAGIAVIAGLLVTLIKPLELFKCARDSQRMNDLQALSSAIQHYIISTSDIDLDGPYQNRGVDESSSTIFISVPSDKESLPTTFVVGTSTFIVNSVNSNNLKNIDGTGWLPINFQSLEVRAINVLPIDPVNSYASKYFYSYVFHRGMRSFELNANLECNRYKKGGVEDKTSTDGGDDPDVYEVSSMLTLLPSEIYLSQRIKGLKPIIGLSDATTTITTVLNSVSSTKVYIYNLGSTTLAVYNITQQPAQARISTDKNYIIVPPWSFEPLTITCNARDVYSTTTYTTTFKLWNNDFQNNPYNLNVICNITTAPRITITPKELWITTKTGASSTGVIKISNKGSTDLNITNINLYSQESTSTCDNFVSFNLSSSVIPSNQSATLTTIVDATTLNSKHSFYCKYYIESNDPYRPLQIVKVNIKVKSPPGEVFNVQVEKAGSQKLKLSWSEPNDNGYDNIIGYRIYRRINATPTQSDFATSVPSTTFSFLDSGLENGTNYCYRVSAVNGVGEGPLSSQIACGIPMATPSPPVLSASPGNKKVDLSWAVSDNGGSIITGYDIYWKTANDTSWKVLLKDYQNNSTTHFVSPINNCINYQYYVIAKNSEGSSNPSNIASATPYGTSSPPKNASSTAGANYVDLTWQIPDDVGCPALSYYNIYKASSTPQNFVLIASTTSLSYRDYNVTSSVTYYYYITAVNSYGESDKSNIISARPGLSKCPAPTNLTLTPNDRRITLNWNTSLSSGYYYLYYSSNTPSNFVKFATVTHPSSTYTHTGLINGEVYYYYVTAENPGTCLESNSSNIASSSPGSVPSPPKNFKANSYQDRIELSWQPPESDGGFPILYYSLYRNYNLIATTSASTLSYIDRNIDPSSVYTYSVSATNKIGRGEKAYVNAGYCPSWSIIYGSENDDKPAYTFLLSNGKYIIVGETTLSSDKGGLGGKDGFLMRVDSLGNLELLNTYGGTSDDSIRSFVELQDGNYLIAGTTKSFGDTNGDIFVAKLSSSTGNVIWAKIYGTNGVDDYPFITRYTPSSSDNINIYLTFSTQHQTFGRRDIVVMKLDQNGNIIWQKRFGGGGDDIPYKIYKPYELLFYVAGYTQSYGAGNWDWLLMELDQDGNLLRAKTYGGNNADYLFDISSDVLPGKLSLFGRTLSFGAGGNDYMLLKIDLSTYYNYLNVSSGYTFGTPGQDYGFAHTIVNNRNLLLGRTDNLGAGSNDLLLIEQNNFDWNNSKIITMGGSLSEELPTPPIPPKSYDSLNSNKILITARTNSSGFGGNDIWLVKLDPDLNIKNSQNQTGFEPGSGYTFSYQSPSSIIFKDIKNSIIEQKITNQIGNINFVSKNQNISLTTRNANFYKKLVAYCSYSLEPTPPSAPTLSVTAGNRQNTLNWTQPSDGGSPILEYRVYQYINGNYTLLATTSPSIRTYTHQNLTNGQQYCYAVSARNSVGEGSKSNIACGTPTSQATPPSAPTLSVTAGNRQNTLNWTQPSDGGSPILEYRVYQYINGNYTLLATTSPSIRTYTHQNLTNGQQYCYAVSARNSVGEGSKSNIACGTPTSQATPPSAPTLSVTAGNRQNTLNWTQPSDGGSPILEYRVYQYINGNYTLLATTSPSIRTYTHQNLTNGQQYCYAVSARNSVGEGSKSNIACGTPKTVPSTPRNLKAVNQTTYNQLNWDPPLSDGGSPILYYKIYRRIQNEQSSPLFLATTTNISFTDNNISQNKTYCYKVSAVNAVGEGPMSEEACAIPGSGGATVPGTPSLTVTPGNRQNTLNWTQPSDGGSPILEYRVYQYINGNYTLLATTSPSIRTYTHQNLTNGQQYCYAVSARNSVGEGSRSNIACGTPRGVPSPPQNLQATVGDRVISLSWSAPLDNGGSPITEYRIYRRLSGSSYNFNSPLATTSASILSYNDTNVIPGNTYCYVVKAKNQYGESNPSNEVCKKAGSAPGQWQIRVEDYGRNWVRLQFTCISFPESSYCTGGYPITKIKIYKGTSPSSLSLYSELRDPASRNYRFTDTGLSSGVTYYYAIKVVNELNLEGPTSSVVSVTPSEREITGNIKVLWGLISRIGGENRVVVQDAFPAIGIQFDTPQYIDRLEMRTDPINPDYLKYLCDNYGGSDINSWIKSPTTTLSIKRTCKTLIFYPNRSIISFYFIGKDANDIFNRQQITIYGTGFNGTLRWVSLSLPFLIDSIGLGGDVIHTAIIFDIKIYK